MLTTIFFYIKQFSFNLSDNKYFFNIFSPLFHSLSKHKISSYFLAEKKDGLLPYPTIYFSEHNTLLKEDVTFSQNKSFSSFLSTHAPNKDEVLFVSDCAEFLTALTNLNYYTIGFSSSDTFLPTPYVFESFEHLDYTYFLHIWKRYQKEPIKILETRNLIIRELSTADFPSLYSLYEDKENIAYMETEKDYISFCEKMSSYIETVYPFYDFGLWGVFLKETNALIGEFGIQPTIIDGNDEIELGYLLHRDYQHKGYAKETIRAIFRYAKNQLDCNRIVAKIHKDNKASLATATACGMRFEKKLQEPDNNFHLYAIYVQTDYFSSALKKQRETAAKQVYEIFQKHPDTRVYGKRYRHNK